MRYRLYNFKKCRKLRILIINVRKKKVSNMGLIKSSLIPFSKLHDIKMFQFARLRIESRAFFVSASQMFNVKKI